MTLQHEQEARLDERLPLPQVHLPFVFTAGLGPSEIGQLAEELERGLRLSRHDVRMTARHDASSLRRAGRRALDRHLLRARVGSARPRRRPRSPSRAPGRVARPCVVTIDPAKRLADALGLAGGLTNEPRRIAGPWPGELWAVMLDTKTTFDNLVVTYAADAEQAERILANRFYRNISGALSGTQEYMAAEKLYELHEEADFDLVVVDTPPTRNALDFLDAPERLTRFLDHRLYRILMTPTRAYLKAVNVAAQAFLRTLSKVVGGDVLAGRHRLLPGLRRHGAGLPRAGQAGGRAADRTRHGLRAGGLAPHRHRGGGLVLRREARRERRGRSRPWW